MTLAAAAVFLLSLAGIVALFALKYRESARGAVFAPEFRRAADERARALKALLQEAGKEAEKLPPRLASLSRALVHDLALVVAYAGRALERKAYGLADMVSHKHRFEKKEPRSDFLKRVNEAKDARDTSLDRVLEE